MKTKLLYILLLIITFIAGYFIIDSIVSKLYRFPDEHYNFDNSKNFVQLKTNIQTLNVLTEELNKMEGGKYSKEDLEYYQNYFRGYYIFVSNISLLKLSGEKTFTNSQIKAITAELTNPDYSIEQKIRVYRSLGKYSEKIENSEQQYINRIVDILYLSDPGGVMIGLIDENYVRFTKRPELSSSMYTNFLISYLDYHILDHIDLLKMILE